MKNTTPRILSVKGDLDLDTFPRLLREAEKYFDQGQIHLVVDLSKAGSITSGGLYALEAVMARSARLGGKTQLVGVSDQMNHWITSTTEGEHPDWYFTDTNAIADSTPA